MKKLIVVVLALAFVLGLGALASAADLLEKGSLVGNTVYDTVPVRAEVGKYAQVIAGDGLQFIFVGAAGENQTDETTVSIESNCTVNLQMDATALRNNGDWIGVTYELKDNDAVFATVNTDSDGDNDSYDGIQGKAAKNYTLAGSATLREISAQAAGTGYAATVTITVSAQ